MSKWREETIQLNEMEQKFVPLVSSSIVAINGFADGKALPVLFLDLRERPDVIELINNHQYVKDKGGEATAAWILDQRKLKGKLKLLFDFKKPTECKLIVEFDIQKNGPTIDMIIRSGGCWIMSSEVGNTIATTQGEKRICVEVKNYDFIEVWEQVYLENMIRHFRKKGYAKKLSSKMAKSFIDEMRKTQFRI
jgi:hypothetical protein